MSYVDQLGDIMRRKRHLIAVIGEQRDSLAADWQAWGRPVALMDRAIALVGFFKANPLLVAVGVALFTVFRPHSFKGWLGRGLILWRLWRSARGWLRRLSI